MPISVANGMLRSRPVTQLNKTELVELPKALEMGFHITHSCARPNPANVAKATAAQTHDMLSLASESTAGKISEMKRSAWNPLST